MTERLFVLILTSVLISGCAGPNVDTEQSPYITLFNGRNLDGWIIENNRASSAKDGVMVLNKGTVWLRSEDEFGD